jgi:hypothetical protein
MGHGLQIGQSVTVLDDAVKMILEAQFQLGVTRSSNRKGVLEMVEECGKTMPKLMAPAIHEVSSWLSSRLAKDNKKSNEAGSSAAQKETQRIKSPGEKRQKDAAVMKRYQKDSLRDASKQHLFLAKYLGILLMKSGVIMIVTTAKFSADRKIWLLTANTAKLHKYDDRVYIADPDCIHPITIDVSVTKGGLATYIKDFNKLNKILI